MTWDVGHVTRNVHLLLHRQPMQKDIWHKKGQFYSYSKHCYLLWHTKKQVKLKGSRMYRNTITLPTFWSGKDNLMQKVLSVSHTQGQYCDPWTRLSTTRSQINPTTKEPNDADFLWNKQEKSSWPLVLLAKGLQNSLWYTHEAWKWWLLSTADKRVAIMFRHSVNLATCGEKMNLWQWYIISIQISQGPLPPPASHP